MPANEASLTSLRDVRLVERPGRLLLLAGDERDALATALAVEWRTPTVSVGRRFAASDSHVTDARQLVGDAWILTDLDVLFWAPVFQLEILTFLRGVARDQPAAFVWPGAIIGAMARYSDPGRKDFYEAELEDAIVLRAEPGRFGDEPNYTMELVGA